MTVTRRQRIAILAGLAVAVVAYVLIRRRNDTAGYAGIPAGPVEGQAYDGYGTDSAGTIDTGGGGVGAADYDALVGELSTFVRITEQRQTDLERLVETSILGGTGGGGGWLEPKVIPTADGTVVIGPDGQVTVLPRVPTVAAAPSGQKPVSPNAVAQRAKRKPGSRVTVGGQVYQVDRDGVSLISLWRWPDGTWRVNQPSAPRPKVKATAAAKKAAAKSAPLYPRPGNPGVWGTAGKASSASGTRRAASVATVRATTAAPSRPAPAPSRPNPAPGAPTVVTGQAYTMVQRSGQGGRFID